MSDPNDPRDLQRRALRASLRAQRDALGPRERMIAADGLSEQLEQLAEFLTDERVAGYWAVRGELSLHRVLPPLAARGQPPGQIRGTVVVPAHRTRMQHPHGGETFCHHM